MYEAKSPSRGEQRVLELFARWISGSWKINLQLNGDGESFTDCKTFISLGWSAVWILKHVETKAQWIAALKGIIEHEAAHCLFSDNDKREDYYIAARKAGIPHSLADWVEGVLEDARVNRCHVNNDPQSLLALQWLYELLYRKLCEDPLKDFDDEVLLSVMLKALIGKPDPRVSKEAQEAADRLNPKIESAIQAESSKSLRQNHLIPICLELMKVLKIERPIDPPKNEVSSHKDSEYDGKGMKARGNLDARQGNMEVASGHAQEGALSTEDLQENRFDKLFEKCNSELESAEGDISQEDEIYEGAPNRNTLEDVKTVAKGIHEGVNFSEEKSDTIQIVYEDLYESVIELISLWTELLQAKINRKKTALIQACLSGYLDSKRVYQAVAFGNPRVFRQPGSISDKPDMAVYNLVDASGSMYCEKRYIEAQKASVCLANTLEVMKVPHTVVAFSGIDSTQTVVHQRLVAWDEKDKSRISGYRIIGSNRDGYSIRMATEELKKRPERSKILLIECDGVPCSFGSYYGFRISDNGTQDTADAVQEARDAGIKVIVLFFGSAVELEVAQYMYGESLVIVSDIRDLIYEVIDMMDDELNRVL